MSLRRYLLLSCLLVASATIGCSSGEKPVSKSQAAVITLQTTTSPRDSGLLDYLLPKFKERSGIEVKVVAVGSGQALENARRGDGDVVISHSPEAERKFIDDGYGVARRPLMENDFIVVGPAADPAMVKGTKSTTDAFRTISETKSHFISRSDESGTHVKEKSLWKEAAVETSGDWYVRAGIGMADALRVADEKQGYLLTDRGTYLALRDKLELVPLVEGDPQLVNRYSVIVVSAAKHPGLHQTEATKFAEFLVAPETKKLIGEFGREKFGEALFRPVP